MNDKFLEAVERVLVLEGGYSNKPNDRGGPTNFGISLRFYRETINQMATETDIKNLTRDKAIEIYHSHFWIPIYNDIESQPVRNYIFDMAVLHGLANSTKIVQRALWALMVNTDTVKDDGVLGKITLYHINDSNGSLMPALRAERAGYCRFIVARDVSQQDNLQGWLNRCYRA